MITIPIRPARWSDFITIGNTIVAMRTGFSSAFGFYDTQKWCEPCGCVCAHMHFIRMLPADDGSDGVRTEYRQSADL